MRNETRQKFNAYLRRQGEINGVEDVQVPFNVAPTVSQTIETRIQEDSSFLNQINIVTVSEQQGQKLGLGASGTIASRTDTSEKDRETSDPTDMTGQGYFCHQTNFDTHTNYAKLDMWAKFPDFQQRLRNIMLEQQRRDLIMMGWNGTSVAKNSNRTANPLLQDVAKGWIQKLREEKPENIIDGVVIGGTGATHKNIDAPIYEATNEALDEWHRDDTALVAICGREIITDKYAGLINEFNEPTERNALDVMIANKKLGGLKAIRVPFMPARGVLITRLDNLSIYFQEGTRRRHIKEEVKRDRIADYQSVNLDFIIEDLGAACFIDNIQFGE